MARRRCEGEEARRLEERLDQYTAPAALVRPLEDGNVQCLACAHHCVIRPGARGICRMRANRPEVPGVGRLIAPRGYVAGLAADPIEKKPLFHVLPGREALSFGMLGCNLVCDFCQNWISSQALKDADSSVHMQRLSAEHVVQIALERGSPVIASTYNEPLITAEWAHEILSLAKPHGIRGAFISNGYAGPEVLEYLRPVLDVYKVDLKTFQDAHYRQLGGRLQPVLDTIARAREMGFWVEVVTLVIPGFNDSDGELRDMAQFLAGISKDIPWHVTAFHPDYEEKTGARPTTVADITRAAQAGSDAGLRFVYAGNLRGRAGDMENTRCPGCKATLIQRSGYAVPSIRIGANGKCPGCGYILPGIWA